MLALIVGVVALLLAGAATWLYTPDRPRAALEATYARPPSRFVTVAGIRLHLRDTGPRDAPAVLLLHGFASGLQSWDAWAASLDPDHRVIRFDLPGFGLTGPDPTGDYADARAIAVIAALLDALGVERTALIGNSMGGRIAWAFAAARPERVTRLVLVSPDGFAGPGVAYGRTAPVPPLMRVLPHVLPVSMLRGMIAPAYADPAGLTDAVLRRTYDMLRAPGVRQAILDRMAQHSLVDPVPLLRGLHVPTLLLWGEKDAMIPIANAQAYLAALPDARLVALPGIGHVPQEEAPAATLLPVRAFLGP